MPKCPKCKEEIDFFEAERTEKGYASATGIDIDWESKSLGGGEDGDFKFFCPKCQELLFEDWEEAREWINKDYTNPVIHFSKIDEMIEGQIDEKIEAKADLRRKYGE